jgi:acetyl esterase/lipase
MPKPKPTQPQPAFPNISPRWLISAAALVLLIALGLAWATLCLLYWQGNWQLLYHPTSAITRTPATPYEPIRFAATETGQTRLTGWWIPSPNATQTVLYLHSASGNLSSTLDQLSALHNQGLNIFAIDYRGYGQSAPSRPSEKQLRQDAEWSLTWLTLTRQIAPKSIVVFGSELGANLAAELASDHPELAGVVLDQPLQNPMNPVFQDSRSKLVPAQALVIDRFDLNKSAAKLTIPSLWIVPTNQPVSPTAFQLVQSPKRQVWLTVPTTKDKHFAEALNRWLDEVK